MSILVLRIRCVLTLMTQKASTIEPAYNSRLQTSPEFEVDLLETLNGFGLFQLVRHLTASADGSIEIQIGRGISKALQPTFCMFFVTMTFSLAPYRWAGRGNRLHGGQVTTGPVYDPA
jgi:hypothetical protein